MLWVTAYIIAGVAVFYCGRVAFRRAKLDPRPHDWIWLYALCSSPWAIPLWPLLAAASCAWFVAEIFHTSGKREIRLREEAEAKREKRYDHLTLERKIELLEAEARKRP